MDMLFRALFSLLTGTVAGSLFLMSLALAINTALGLSQGSQDLNEDRLWTGAKLFAVYGVLFLVSIGLFFKVVNGPQSWDNVLFWLSGIGSIVLVGRWFAALD